jgi:hypothetical protein
VGLGTLAPVIGRPAASRSTKEWTGTRVFRVLQFVALSSVCRIGVAEEDELPSNY